MGKRIIVTTLLITSFIVVGCKPTEKEIDPKSFNTIKERLEAIKSIENVKSLGNSKSFKNIYRFSFKQYIDHNNKELGTFDQHVEFGFNGFDVPNVYVTSGYMISENNSYYSTNENEIAFLLNCNYVFVEHRYFDDSLPNAINYDDNTSWKYLSTEQAAHDAHEIVTQLKRALDGKWVSTGISKGGMTTELYAYYHPGDMDLYVPYVAPFCNSFSDKRMIQFLNEEVGNIQYGEEKAKEMRDNILAFQVKMIQYRDTFASRFYEEGLAANAKYSSYATQDNLYESAVLEFGIGFWQYYQSYSTVKSCLNMKENTSANIAKKKEAFYSCFTNIISPSDLGIDNDFTPYYIQAYQELVNYGYDFSYLRNALPEGTTLTVTEQEESDLMWKLVLSENELALGHKELIGPKINNMLATTNDQFIILYGNSDPWYAVRPTDVNRENISIYVNPHYPHTTNIQNYDENVKNEILQKIKTALGVE